MVFAPGDACDARAHGGSVSRGAHTTRVPLDRPAKQERKVTICNVVSFR